MYTLKFKLDQSQSFSQSLAIRVPLSFSNNDIQLYTAVVNAAPPIGS